MLEINTQIIINTSLEKVWATLIDFDSYKLWNPFILDIKGELQLENRLIVTIKPQDKKKMVFKPKIISLIHLQEFVWIGNLIIPGIFDGQHQFFLKKLADNKIQLIHSERFSGMLSKPIFKLISNSTQLGFEQMNAAIKERCEKWL